MKQAAEACKLTNQHIYFDNFFSSCNFIRELGAKGLKVTGTIRKNRVENCPLPSADDMKKKPRGSYAFKSDGDIELVRWNENNVVTLCSKALGLEPIGQAKRWKGGQFVNIDQPCEIKHYKYCTGGVDFVNRALSDYRPEISPK